MGTSISHSNICTASVESRVNIYHSEDQDECGSEEYGMKP